MKKLLLKTFLLIFLTGTGLLLLFFFFPRPAYDPTYEAAILDKHRLLASSMPPRIIFIGGSNLAFGLDSKMIEKGLGVRTINMGLHAGLGLRYMLFEIKPFVGRGDVVVVIPEYEQFFDSAYDGGDELAYVAMRFPETRRYLTSWKQYRTIILGSSYAFRGSIYNLLTGSRFNCSVAYRRDAFSDCGDSIGHLDKEPFHKEIQRGWSEGRINREAIDGLNDVNAYVEVRGGKVFFIYPAVEEKQYKLSEKQLNMLSDCLARELKIRILGKPLDYVFPEDHFFDTVYHLNCRGRAERTVKISKDLQKVL